MFTHFLMEGLEGAADEDGDQIVTLGEATEYVRDRVRRETRNAQIPTISQTAFDTYLPLALAPKEAAVPPEPTEALRDTVAPPVPDSEVVSDPMVAARADTTAPRRPPAAGADTTGPLAVGVERFDPRATFLKSLVVPGLGQLTTRRPGVGLAFLAAAGGAIATGVLFSKTDIVCAAPSGGECPSSEVISSSESRPYLLPGLGAAVAIAIISAIEARAGAVRANDRTSRGGRTDGTAAPREHAARWSVGPSLDATAGRFGIRVERRF